jgi:NADH:ubiquinone oxidoreductase subunit 6 (subunit J)
MISGIIGALALAIYVTFLGTREPLYEFMRRFGIYFAYLGTALAQFLVALALARISKALQYERVLKTARILLTLCAVTFGLGILNIVLRAVLEDTDASENRIEWIASILMQVYFLVLFLAWRSTDMTTLVRVRKSAVG